MGEYTVVIPVYNVEKYLNRCVDSILAQTVKPSRIILVDDGSSDSSGQICEEYAKRESTVTVLHQRNQGAAAARNRGIDLTDTELITFVDSDDYISPNMYEVLLRNMMQEQADMSICGLWVEKESGVKYPYRTTGVKKVWDAREALIVLNSYQYFNMSFCNIMFRRELFEWASPLRFPEGRTCEDYYLMPQVIARVQKLVYDSDPYYHYVQRENSVSRNKAVNLEPMDASLAQLAFYEKNYPDIAYVAKTACAFSHMGIYTAYVRSGQACPKELLKKLKTVSRRYLPAVLGNRDIPRMKKLQAVCFCCCLPIYKCVIGHTEHR